MSFIIMHFYWMHYNNSWFTQFSWAYNLAGLFTIRTVYVTASYWVSPIRCTYWWCVQCALYTQSKQLQVHTALHWINSMMAHSSGNSCILDFLLSHIFKSDCPVIVVDVATAATADINATVADTCWILACDVMLNTVVAVIVVTIVHFCFPWHRFQS